MYNITCMYLKAVHTNKYKYGFGYSCWEILIKNSENKTTTAENNLHASCKFL